MATTLNVVVNGYGEIRDAEDMPASDEDLDRVRAALAAHGPMKEALEAYQRANRLHHDGEAALYEQAEAALALAQKVTP